MIALIVKSTLITIAIHAIIRIMRRANASTRHLVLSAAFAALVILPGASLMLPPLTLHVPLVQEREQSVEPSAAVGTTFGRIPPLARTADPIRVQRTAHGGDISFGLPGAQLLTITWIVGVMVSLVPLVVGLRHSARMRRRGSNWTVPDALAPALPVRVSRGHVEVRVYEGAATPMTCGAFRPVVILPSDVDLWSNHDVRRALAHELEHVRRRDWLTLCLTRAVCALYWFNPLVWTAWSRLRLEAERACDDVVLRDEEPVDYADQLVTLAQRKVPRPLLVTMASPDDLSVRIGALLDSTQPRGGVGGRRAAGVLLTAVCSVSLIAAVRAQPSTRVQAARDLLPLQTAADTQSRSQNWQMHETDHFVIHYPQELASAVDSLAVVAEVAYRELQRDFDWKADAPLPLVLVRDVSPASVQNAGPAAPLQGNRVLVPIDLSPDAVAPFFRHELTHMFEFERLWEPSAGRPHWLFEGLAGYEGGVWSVSDQEQLRSLIQRGPLPSLTEEFARALPLMTPAAAPALGHALFEFMATRFGRDGVREFVAAWSGHVLDRGGDPFDAALPIAGAAFDREFEAFLRQEYGARP